MTRRFIGILIILVWVGAATAGQPRELAEALEAVRVVGPEGRGNAEAAVAWKELAAGDATTLLPLLEAMDGANELAQLAQNRY